MRILGAWGPFDAAYIRALIICEEMKIKGIVKFLIDSGASRTSILDSDAQRLAIDHKELEKFTPGTTGIGGAVDTFMLPNVRMVFRAAKGLHEEKLDNLFVLRHDIKEAEATERIKKLPSLLGRDILNKYRTVLDRNEKLVLITDER